MLKEELLKEKKACNKTQSKIAIELELENFSKQVVSTLNQVIEQQAQSGFFDSFHEYSMHAYQDSEVASPLFHSHRKLELPMKLGRETSIKTDMHRVVGMQMNFNPLQFADGGGVDNTRPSNKLYTQIETLE